MRIIRVLNPEYYVTEMITIGDFDVAMDCPQVVMSLFDHVKRYVPNMPISLGFHSTRITAIH